MTDTPRAYIDYQRVHMGTLYGFVRIIDGEPERTYCCSLTPSVYVHPVGWLDESEGDFWEPPEGGYYSLADVRASLTGPVFDAENDDDAREEAQGNW